MSNAISKITKLKWNFKNKVLEIHGFAFLQQEEVPMVNSSKRSIEISNGKQTFIIPAINKKNHDITVLYGEETYNYDFSGFIIKLDTSRMDNVQPLDVGEWSFKMHYIGEGIEEKFDLIIDETSDLVVDLPIIRCLSKNKARLFKVDQMKSIFSLTIADESCDEETYEKSLKVDKNLKRKLNKKERIMLGTYNILTLLKIKRNRVCFLSDSRAEFTGNFEFVYNELKSSGQYEIKSILKKRIDEKKSYFDFFKLVYYMATSKYIVLDDFYPLIYKFELRKETEVIQLWHATGAFKTFGFTRLGKVGGPKIKSRNHKNYTKAIVSSDHIRKHYAEAFGIELDNVVATGVPRTDIFFDEVYKEKTITSLYEKYPQLKDKKIITFAPTFRGKGQKTAHYDFDKLDFEALRNRFGDEYIIIMKIHPFVKKIPDFKEYEGFVLDLSHEREINDLLFITDILITDYSSVCFEFALLNRPMIFFAYDLEKYIAARDFYYPFKSFVPGPIVKTTEELIDVIETGDFDHEKLEEFRTKFFDDFDGNSTKRVVEQLFKIN